MVLESLGFMGNILLVLEIANLCVLLGLLYVYIKSYRQIKIGFTIGLILFASIFIIKSIVAMVFLITSHPMINVSNDLTKEFVGTTIELIAFTVLLGVTWDN